MRILFITTQTDSKEDQSLKAQSQLIKWLLISKKLKITSTFEPDFYRVLGMDHRSRLKIPLNSRLVFSQITDSTINKHDAVIIEASVPDLNLGLCIEKSTNLHKPVLVISRTKDYSTLSRSPYFSSIYIKSNQPIPTGRINSFLRKVEKHGLSERFNLLITEEQREHLSQISKIKNTTVSEHVRRLIEKDLLEAQAKE